MDQKKNPQGQPQKQNQQQNPGKQQGSQGDQNWNTPKRDQSEGSRDKARGGQSSDDSGDMGSQGRGTGSSSERDRWRPARRVSPARGGARHGCARTAPDQSGNVSFPPPPVQL